MPDSKVASRLFSGARRAADLLFPPRCLSCDADLHNRSPVDSLCESCYDSLAFIQWPTCRRCAARVPAVERESLPCSHCRGVSLAFDRAMAVGEYRGLLRDLILRMKSDSREILARLAAKLVWTRLNAPLCEEEFDVVVAAPMHPWRRFRRHAHASRAIAESLAPELGVAAAGGLLGLRRNVPPQIGLTRPARFRNVRGQMNVRRGHHLESARVLLVDDVLTSGATCSEAARTLKAAGAASVTVVAVARTSHEP
ncbi:MAG: double zinc ribbon domain-containing protein [Planctomycetota bacterium]